MSLKYPFTKLKDGYRGHCIWGVDCRIGGRLNDIDSMYSYNHYSQLLN